MMREQNPLKGFSKLSRDEKVKWLSEYLSDQKLSAFLDSFRMPDEENQNKFESFSENTLSNYHLPWGLVPNVLIDDKLYHVPVVIEESSVVAAASKAASFWAQRGGFRTLYISTLKKGQLHFTFSGDGEALKKHWETIGQQIKSGVKHLTQNMEQRGGGITGIHLKQIPGLPYDYYQLDLEAETMDSMGANFINSILEEAGRILPELIHNRIGNGQVEIIMAILSNYTPESIVKLQVQAPVSELSWAKEMTPEKFARRMKWAADIAWHDTGRAVTHNKGIYNGVDAVVLATGNDFRAVEAAGHAYAARDGQYHALSRVNLENDIFSLELEIPMALGTVGGLTKLHPLAAKTLQILGEPDARTLMKIAAAIGLANNFAAMASLVTTGIQQGHMKMHLHNILNSLDVNPEYYPKIEEHFSVKTVSVSAVRQFISTLK
ncbi:MAG: hydroxymethylglutaryl-CoA reductase, degradative [Bacteroidales bacterium]|nr:hydroxymethylglutaryl-CoA reductase, degradative [Bacteroidales bacterium]